jgi:hypothetical protein
MIKDCSMFVVGNEDFIVYVDCQLHTTVVPFPCSNVPLSIKDASLNMGSWLLVCFFCRLLVCLFVYMSIWLIVCLSVWFLASWRVARWGVLDLLSTSLADGFSCADASSQ